jgi:hypothetical protein
MTVPPSQSPDVLTCSAKGCRSEAAWALRWNNPKLHTPDRRKTWLACDEHRQSLADFLGARGFLREVAPVDDATRRD